MFPKPIYPKGEDGTPMSPCSECKALFPREDTDALNKHMQEEHPDVVAARIIDHDQQPPGQVLR